MPNVKRFLVYILGLIVLAFGIAFSIRSGLGVSPVSSVPYTLSRITGLTVGLTTTAFYAACVLLQLVILRKDFKVRYLLQLFFAYAFGLFTDMSLFLTRTLVVDAYPLRLLLLAISLILIGFGVYTVVLTDVVMNAPDGLVKAISNHWHLEFSRVKSTFDILCVSTSVILSLVFLGSITGLREGTVIAALSIGRIIGFISRRYRTRIVALYT
jgi:uncharacterized membrane protein YczE